MPRPRGTAPRQDPRRPSARRRKARDRLYQHEEEGVGLTDVVPFLVEDELKAKGGKFEGGEDWGVFIVTDGLLTTGQNPASSSAAAKRLLEKVAK